MVTFTETTFHELLDSDKTTPSTVLDSDGKLKQSLHNMFPSTDVTDTDYWTQTNITVTESGTSPSGKTAYLLTEGTNVAANFRLHDNITVYGSRYYALSIDAKRGSGSRNISVILGSGAFGSSIRHTLDLDTGEVTASVTGTKDAAIATELSDGWWNFTVYAEATSNFTPAFNYYIANGTNTSYTGDGTSSIYVSRPRLYEASVHVPVERVENGTFDSDVSGWTKEGTTSHTLTYSSGTAILTKDASSAADDAFVQTSIPTVSGEKYRISFKGKRGSGSGAARLTAWAAGGSILYASDYITDTSFVTKTDVFTATSSLTNVYILCGGGLNAGTAVFDDISLTKVINDGIQNDLDGEDFIETSGSAVYHGGLEYNGDGSFRGIQSFEGRTNLIKHSSLIGGGFWATSWGGGVTVDLNAVVSPSGQLDASRLNTTDGAGDGSQATLSGLTVDNYYTASVFLKNDDAVRTDVVAYINSANEFIRVNWSGSNISSIAFSGTNTSNGRYEDYGNGWYRVSFVVQAKATSGNFVIIPENNGSNTTGSVYAWGAQFEGGQSPSPYVPTTSSTRNRVKDSTHKDLVEFGFNQNELTVFCEFESAGSTGSDYPWAWCISGGNNSNRYGSYGFITGSTPRLVFSILSDGTANSLTFKNPYTRYSNTRTMMGFKGTDNSASADGDDVTTNDRPIGENMSILEFGQDNYQGNQLNGHIKKLIIWPKRLADATLEAESE